MTTSPQHADLQERLQRTGDSLGAERECQIQVQHLSLENLLHVNYLEYAASKFTEHAPPFRRVCLLLAPPRQIVMTIAASSKKRRNSCSWFALEVLACSFPLMLCKRRLNDDSQVSTARRNVIVQCSPITCCTFVQ